MTRLRSGQHGGNRKLGKVFSQVKCCQKIPWWTAGQMPLISEWRVRIGYSEVQEANQKKDGPGALQLTPDVT